MEVLNRVYTEELIKKDKSKFGQVENVVYQVQSYVGEIISGEDFIQWFRWTSPSEVEDQPEVLKGIGALKSSEVCKQAIMIAFPKGAPKDRKAYEDRLFALEFEDAQSKQKEMLLTLAKQQLAMHDSVCTNLARWIRNQQR